MAENLELIEIQRRICDLWKNLTTSDKPKYMQSMIHKGIHFCGAKLNIDDDTVSLNFQSA